MQAMKTLVLILSGLLPGNVTLAGGAEADRTATDAAIIPRYEKINPARTLLTPTEIRSALARLPGWQAADGRLKKPSCGKVLWRRWPSSTPWSRSASGWTIIPRYSRFITR